MINVCSMLFYMKKNNQFPQDAIEVGRIIGPWGIKGAIKVASFSEDAQALFHASIWYILPPEQKFTPKSKVDKPVRDKDLPLRASSSRVPTLNAQPLPSVLTIKDIRVQADTLKVEASEITDRNMAEALKGARIFISRTDFPVLDEGEFYWTDLIGLKVINQEGILLGQVTDLMSNGPQSILRVAYEVGNEDGEIIMAERLIPFVDAFVGEVDLQKGTIYVDWQPDY